MSGALYTDPGSTASEWAGESNKGRNFPYPDDATGWENFFAMREYCGFQYIRLEAGLTQWEPYDDNIN